uniref:Zinc finger DHHC-type containing 1 n=1 Tax=Cyprinodon variegatus TaxID=28743 RepID=A0A3Q2DMF6_CYPVA
MMDVCGRNPNRTAPVSEDASRRSDVPLCSRTNGWSWPPHPFQLLAWLLYAYFAIAGFGVFVPLLPAHWIPAGYIVSFLFPAAIPERLLSARASCSRATCWSTSWPSTEAQSPCLTAPNTHTSSRTATATCARWMCE